MHPANYIIRNAAPADIDDMTGLLKQLFALEKDFVFDPEKQQRGLRMMLDGCGKHRALKVAQSGTRVVGMCSAQTRISTAQGNITAVVEDLVVDRHFRNRGIGCALLNAVCTWADSRGISFLSLLADRDNTSAVDFYLRHQWGETNLICLTQNTRL
ncbi:MAG: GNAT family N-acetyltransferase [Desulfobacteraceae bacterium]|nr:MAG: GNAT family N-acetyltransferase [Desulfobacteraceae bacterium]